MNKEAGQIRRRDETGNLTNKETDATGKFVETVETECVYRIGGLRRQKAPHSRFHDRKEADSVYGPNSMQRNAPHAVKAVVPR